MIKAPLFDWGNTLMVDFAGKTGPMYLWDRVEPTKNAVECLSSISSSIQCYIATNAKDSAKEDIYKALERVGLGTFITDIFCYREIGFEKPSPEFFDSIVAKLSLSREEIVLIGDDLEKDYRGAKRNGIQAILYDPENIYIDVDFRITSLMDLKDMVNRLSAPSD